MGDGDHYRKVEIHALARTVDPGRQRMWVGVFDHDKPEHLTWTTETTTPGQTVDIAAEPIRKLEALPPGATDTETYSGVYELILPDPAPGSSAPSSYTVRAYATWKDGRASRSNKLLVRPLPATMPTGFGESFNVLLVSCFFEGHDTSGLAGAVVDRITRGPDRPTSS